MARLIAFLSLSLAFSLNLASAQVLTSEGIAGDIDAKSRTPSLSVSASVSSQKVTILADASQPSDDFSKYPIQFDFFVNRRFVTSLYRSPTLPGPIGIDITPDIATPPFNYVVIAKTLHPNSIYTTVIEAAVFNQTLSGTVDCTVTRNNSAGAETIYTAQQVTIGQSGDNSFSTSFDATSQDGQERITVLSAASISSGGQDLTGTVTITESSSAARTVDGSGSVTKDGDQLTSLSLTSTEGDTTLNCSR